MLTHPHPSPVTPNTYPPTPPSTGSEGGLQLTEGKPTSVERVTLSGPGGAGMPNIYKKNRDNTIQTIIS